MDFPSFIFILVFVIGAIIGIVFVVKRAVQKLRIVFQNPGTWIFLVAILLVLICLIWNSDKLIPLIVLLLFFGAIVYGKNK